MNTIDKISELLRLESNNPTFQLGYVKGFLSRYISEEGIEELDRRIYDLKLNK